ncbi:MAG: DUF2235 domain-containing protein [Pseudomonadota bacterium]
MRALLVGVFVAFLGGCPAVKDTVFPHCNLFSETATCIDAEAARDIAIFFDGTANTEESRTNVFKLHSLITLQDRPHVHTYYLQGVGTDRKLTGNALGRGIGDRAKLAYLYLANTYRPGDNIYLFGFSRGAYNARILAGMIYVAEFPDLGSLDDNEQRSLVDEIYEAYTSTGELSEKRDAVARIASYSPVTSSTRIRFMGIFDTVSALSYEPDEENQLAELSEKYVDQICNIDRVAHAMSIDDNRGRTFSPVSLKVTAIGMQCDEIVGIRDSEEQQSAISSLIGERISEVWFSGAHSDIGGGYTEDALSGVPINWMLRRMLEVRSLSRIIPPEPFQYEDIYGTSHIGEDALINGGLYINKNRILPYYGAQLDTAHQRLSIHSSVLLRRSKVPRTCREFDFNLYGDPEDRSHDWCYREPMERGIGNYSECFKRVPLKSEHLVSDRRLADFTLQYTCDEGNSLFDIDEPELY